MAAFSGAKTGRSPLDKRVVEEQSTKDDVWWGAVNIPVSLGAPFSKDSASSQSKEALAEAVQQSQFLLFKARCQFRPSWGELLLFRIFPSTAFRSEATFSINRERAIDYLNTRQRLYVPPPLHGSYSDVCDVHLEL